MKIDKEIKNGKLIALISNNGRGDFCMNCNKYVVNAVEHFKDIHKYKQCKCVYPNSVMYHDGDCKYR